MIEQIKQVIDTIAEGVWCQSGESILTLISTCPFCYSIKPDNNDYDHYAGCLTTLAREIKTKIKQSSRKEISIEEWKKAWKEMPKYTGNYFITNKMGE